VSLLEDDLLFQMKAYRLPAPEREHVFAKPRRWRFDFAWPDRKLAAEVEGGTWVRGRHSRGAGMRKDADKYNQAAIMGWYVLKLTSDMVKDGSAIQTVKDALKAIRAATD